jgi:ferredoxin
MAYVVTANCVNCKYTDCVAVCPTEAFREGANMLVIDPDVCIDCDGCVPECPTEAIYPDREVPTQWQEFIGLNARLAKEWPVINEKKGCIGHLEDGKSRRELVDERPAVG